MLESVHVRNFQSLSDVKVDFGTLTVIVGQNDLGKSALFRAIRSAAEGAAGTNFITYGHSLCRVTVRVDGHELIWEKGPTANRYILDGLPFEKVGRQVPPDVSSLLSMGSVQFDTNFDINLNFADQDDPPFLVPFPGGVTGSMVAKVLGDLTNLNVLYKAISESDRLRKQAEQQARLRQSDADSLSSQISMIPDLHSIETSIISLESSWNLANGANEEFISLSYARNDRENLRLRHEELTTAATAYSNLDDQNNLLEESQTLARDLLALRSHRVALSELTSRLAMASHAYESAVDDESSAETSFEELLSSMDVCPLCLQAIPSHVHA